MRLASLIRITDPQGKVAGIPGGIVYQCLDDEKLGELCQLVIGLEVLDYSLRLKFMGEAQLPDPTDTPFYMLRPYSQASVDELTEMMESANVS